MIEKDAKWNSTGPFHMRPAGIFSQEMSRYKSSVRLGFGGLLADGKSMMNLMAASIPAGAAVKVECQGPDEDIALEHAVRLLEQELGE